MNEGNHKYNKILAVIHFLTAIPGLVIIVQFFIIEKIGIDFIHSLVFLSVLLSFFNGICALKNKYSILYFLTIIPSIYLSLFLIFCIYLAIVGFPPQN